MNCATNQPNVFIDPKSIESFAPYYSNRAVDRVVRAGKKLIVTLGEVFAEEGAQSKQVALITASLMVIDTGTGLRD